MSVLQAVPSKCSTNGAWVRFVSEKSTMSRESCSEFGGVLHCVCLFVYPRLLC